MGRHVTRMRETRNAPKILNELYFWTQHTIVRILQKLPKILIGKPERKNDSEDLGIDVRIIAECILCENIDWIRVRNQWWDLVNSVKSLRTA